MEKYIDGTGQRILVHSLPKCEGHFCVIHNPSDHMLRSYPTFWDDDRKLMYRVVNGVYLIDPDEMKYQLRKLYVIIEEYRRAVDELGVKGWVLPTEILLPPIIKGD